MRKFKKFFSPEKFVIGTCVIGCAAIAFRAVRLVAIGATLLCKGLKKETPDGN